MKELLDKIGAELLQAGHDNFGVAQGKKIRVAAPKKKGDKPGPLQDTIDMWASPSQVLTADKKNFAALGILKKHGVTADVNVVHDSPGHRLYMRNIRMIKGTAAKGSTKVDAPAGSPQGPTAAATGTGTAENGK